MLSRKRTRTICIRMYKYTRQLTCCYKRIDFLQREMVKRAPLGISIGNRSKHHQVVIINNPFFPSPRRNTFAVVVITIRWRESGAHRLLIMICNHEWNGRGVCVLRSYHGVTPNMSRVERAGQSPDRLRDI